MYEWRRGALMAARPISRDKPRRVFTILTSLRYIPGAILNVPLDVGIDYNYGFKKTQRRFQMFRSPYRSGCPRGEVQLNL